MLSQHVIRFLSIHTGSAPGAHGASHGRTTDCTKKRGATASLVFAACPGLREVRTSRCVVRYAIRQGTPARGQPPHARRPRPRRPPSAIAMRRDMISCAVSYDIMSCHAALRHADIRRLTMLYHSMVYRCMLVCHIMICYSDMCVYIYI